MAESAYTGLTASVKIGADVLGYVSGVDLTLEREIIEILSFGNPFKEKRPAIKDWSVSIDGTVALAAGGTQKALYDAFFNGTLITLGIYLDSSTYFEGSGYASSFNVSATPDDKVSLTSEIAGSGAITLTLGSAITLSVTSATITGTGTATSTVTGATDTLNVASSNPGVATVAVVAAEVTVTGVAPGVCTIFVNDTDTDGTGSSATIVITVVAAET